MPTFRCRTWTGHEAELDAEAERELTAEEVAAHRFATGAFGDYPGEICTVWVADKAKPEVSRCITVRIPDGRPFDAQERTEQERNFCQWIQANLRDPQSLFDDPLPHKDADEAAKRILADADFTNEVEPGIVPIELPAELSRTGKAETFLWKLAGWREQKENGPAKG